MPYVRGRLLKNLLCVGEMPNPCPLCGSVHLQLAVELKAHGIYICQDCTNALTLPPPAPSYDEHQFCTAAQSNEALWRSYMRQVVEFVQRYYGASGRLLDVGCAHGLLLEEAQRLGFEAEGIEP